jgi:fructokinase
VPPSDRARPVFTLALEPSKVNAISIGEVLFDVVGQQEFLGGAPFNFAAHLRTLNHRVFFVSAVGEDARGTEVLRQMSARGLTTDFVLRNPSQPTGTVTVMLDSQAQPTFVIHRPAAYDFPQLSDAQVSQLVSQSPGWIYFGTLVQTSLPARQLTRKLLDSMPHARRFYDVNLRPACHEPGLVRELLGLATVIKLNDQEVGEISRVAGQSCGSLEEFCRLYARRFGWEAVCVTCGAEGCVLLIGDEYVRARGYAVRAADTVGAGDAFAAAFVHGFSAGWQPQQIADFANRVGALIASRPGAVPDWTVEEAQALQPRA